MVGGQANVERKSITASAAQQYGLRAVSLKITD